MRAHDRLWYVVIIAQLRGIVNSSVIQWIDQVMAYSLYPDWRLLEMFKYTTCFVFTF